MNKTDFLFNCGAAADFYGLSKAYVNFTLEHQLYDTDMWESFIRVFGIEDDKSDDGWRGEYWGKTMRGACLMYMYTRDEKLYEILEKAVCGLLSKQRPDGSFSTYPGEKLFFQWDIWCRKYVLTGMLHFYRICKSEELKAKIITAMKSHADAMVRSLGNGENQKKIEETSTFWGGVNSCSVLEPIIDLYKLTGEKKHLDFGEYIISTGGCCFDDLVKLAYENKLMPYQYPEVKAYETISFFEGLLAYYEVTGNDYYFKAVERFIDAVNETDITAIGCAGCTHELFDNSAVKQTEYSEGIMQETCVTVTWMRMLARLYLLTGKEKYYARFEKSALNALHGAVNTKMERVLDLGNGELFEPMPFDSYSPLYSNRRGRGIGGKKTFSFGGYYGCCACIASAGIALIPLCAVMKDENGFVFSSYESGKICSGDFEAEIASEYPLSLNTKIEILGGSTGNIRLRIPEYATETSVYVNGEKYTAPLSDGFMTVSREMKSGDTIEIKGDFTLRTEKLNGKTAYFFGPLTLAADEAKYDFSGTSFSGNEKHELLAPKAGEKLRIKLDNGAILTDYSSCGKEWNSEKSKVSVWLD